jgi:hypothetical protein
VKKLLAEAMLSRSYQKNVKRLVQLRDPGNPIVTTQVLSGLHHRYVRIWFSGWTTSNAHGPRQIVNRTVQLMPDFIEIAENSCGASSDQFWTEMRRFESSRPSHAVGLHAPVLFGTCHHISQGGAAPEGRPALVGAPVVAGRRYAELVVHRPEAQQADPELAL